MNPVDRRAAALANPKPTKAFVLALGFGARSAPTWGGYKHALVDAGVIPSVDSDAPLAYQEAYKKARHIGWGHR